MKVVSGELVEDKVIVSDMDFASEMKQKGYGELKYKKLMLSMYEAAYLVEKGRLEVVSSSKALSFEQLMKKGEKIEKRFMSKYAVYNDIRERGYIVRTGLKYGTDFRVYPRGKSMDEAHTEFILHILSENQDVEAFDFARAARLAHGVKTSLVLALVDAESDVTYYKINWFRP
ncbi:MAG: tRNA-intron lyase [Candidatus Diapherotrites archaeon]|nr:tRNA-intron lyase [Candidatus Diapherotrites archaeon]